MRIAVLLLLPALAVARQPDPEKERRPITANLENVGPDTAARMLKKAVGLRVEFAPQAAARKANVRLVGVPTYTAMTTLADAFGCEARFLGKKRWHVAPAWQFVILDRLDMKMGEKRKLAKLPIDDVLTIVRKIGKVDVTLDRAVDRTLTVSAPVKRHTYRALLDLVVKKHKLRWELRYGVVYVAAPRRLKVMPVLVPELTSRELRGRTLSPELRAMPLPKLGSALNVRLKVAKEFAAHPITASAREITLPQALALSLYPAGLTTVEKDGKFEVRALPSNP
jgi:hypothetical protein